MTFLIDFSSCDVFIKQSSESSDDEVMFNCLAVIFALNESITMAELNETISVHAKACCKVADLKVTA